MIYSSVNFPDGHDFRYTYRYYMNANNYWLRADEKITDEEATAYLQRGLDLFGTKLEGIYAHIDGDDVELEYRLEKVPFQRIRRITGYLVGTLDRFNDAKRAEESDRVKHSPNFDEREIDAQMYNQWQAGEFM